MAALRLPIWITEFDTADAEWSTNASGKTDSAGIFAFQGFHGDYAVTLKTPDASPSQEKLTIAPGQGPQIASFVVGP